MKILVLEDDKLFNDTLEDFLEEEGFIVKTALDPYSALEITYEQKFDLYLFDVNLPYENGFDLLRRLRDANDSTPTIFLTSRNDKASLAEGFGAGGDDYMKKPIDLDELLLRIYALLRRQLRSENVKLGEYTLDARGKQLYLADRLIPLSIKSIELLTLLVIAKGKVVTIDEITSRLWHTNEEISLGSIRVYIASLKKYFPLAIENIRGVGYRFLLTKPS
jgi:DNA-binding response OmpR family regulator